MMQVRIHYVCLAAAVLLLSAIPAVAQKILFESERDGDLEIYSMNADGSGLMNLSNNPLLDRLPQWSPDGTKIVFTSARDGNGEIYVMNADGSSPVNLTNDTEFDFDFNPHWSPEGSKILFESYRNS
ncbi:MAG: hypothetical protein O2795_14195, partial [Acidobacteria bacterium]|nr:hypothetical protein [Acidobacteriota bacterium]